MIAEFTCIKPMREAKLELQVAPALFIRVAE
jgi:hypothetical protein